MFPAAVAACAGDWLRRGRGGRGQRGRFQLRAEHGSDGTLLEARVPPGLAAQLQAAAPAPAAQ